MKSFLSTLKGLGRDIVLANSVRFRSYQTAKFKLNVTESSIDKIMVENG